MKLLHKEAMYSLGEAAGIPSNTWDTNVGILTSQGVGSGVNSESSYFCMNQQLLLEACIPSHKPENGYKTEK